MAKILVVDDDFGTRQTLKYILRSHEVVAVSRGIKAIETLQRQSFDLAFIDVFMPDLSGFDVLEFIQREHVQIKVIMMSAVEDAEIVVQSMKRGAVHFVAKDFEHDALLSLVNSYLSFDDRPRP